MLHAVELTPRPERESRDNKLLCLAAPVINFCYLARRVRQAREGRGSTERERGGRKGEGGEREGERKRERVRERVRVRERECRAQRERERESV